MLIVGVFYFNAVEAGTGRMILFYTDANGGCTFLLNFQA